MRAPGLGTVHPMAVLYYHLMVSHKEAAAKSILNITWNA